MEKVGYITVDAGVVQVGDPCYFMDGGKLPKDFGNGSWESYCEQMGGAPARVWKHDSGVPGAAITVGGFGGDGAYPVYVERDENGRITKMTVEFK